VPVLGKQPKTAPALAEGPTKAPTRSEKQERVNTAVARGVAYLKRQLKETDTFRYGIHPGRGTHTGATALAGLTLLECGVPPGDPGVSKALAVVRAEAPRLTFTYGLALSVLFLDRLDRAAGREAAPGHRDLIQGLALRLAAGQGERGGWGYSCPVLAAAEQEQFLADLRSKKRRRVAAAGAEDNSNTQFATLALWVARKHGVPADEVLARVAAHFRDSQQPDGGWGYGAKAPRWRDSMTCAGLLGLAVGCGVAEPGARRQDPARDRGLRYLTRVVGTGYHVPAAEAAARAQNVLAMADMWKRCPDVPPAERRAFFKEYMALTRLPMLRGNLVDADSWGDLYFLWSLERTAMIYGLQTIGGKDWYAWGSEIIRARQQPDGSWQDRFPGTPDTCFALLFLRRTNLVQDLTDEIQLLQGLVPAPGVGTAFRGGGPPRRPE
jgi:hypothetical protein